MRKERLGIFGGTFDPIHLGHLILAEELREELGLNKVIFIPSAIPPHKENPHLSEAKDRVMMTQIAIQHNPFFELSDLELKRGGKSYTIDSITQFKKLYSQSELYLLLGSDVLEELHLWREPEKIFEQIKVVIAKRPGFDKIDPQNNYVKKSQVIPINALNISSSQIREKVRAGKSIRYLVPPGVEEFIQAKSLYRN